MSQDTPPGFEPSQRTGPFLDLIGPIFTNTDGEAVALGLRARRDHCNARGVVHAATIAALLDVVTGRNCVAAGAPPACVTVNLSIDFMSAARDGDWLEATADVTRIGRNLAFVNGAVHADGRPVAKASAVFAFQTDAR